MADEPDKEEPEASLEEVTQMVFTRVAELTKTLAGTTVPDEYGWFRTMLVGILISTHRNFQAVQTGDPKMPALACWGSRNLLELRVITAYVLRSRDNTTDFMDDLAADVKEFWSPLCGEPGDICRLRCSRVVYPTC